MRIRSTNLTRILWLAGIGLAAGILFLFDPSRPNFYPSCWFHKLTGLNCPGCGSLRAGHELLHGHPVAAFGLNPLFVLCVPLMLGFMVRSLIGANRAKPATTGRRDWWPVFLFVLLLFGVLRNLPLQALAWMSP